MRVLAIYLLILGLTVSPVMARRIQAKDDKKVATTEPGGAPNAAAAEASSSEPDFHQLQDLLLDQQKRIEALEAEVSERSRFSPTQIVTTLGLLRPWSSRKPTATQRQIAPGYPRLWR